MKKNKLLNRLEIRVDTTLTKKLKRYCSVHNVKQSEALRDATTLYIEYGDLKYLLLENAHQDAQFRKAFKKFLMECPKSLNIFFEGFLGPEEKKNSAEYPLSLPGILDSFVTIQGRNAYQKRCGQKNG
jgi:hypothetical protein